MRWKTVASLGAAMLLVPATASAAPELSTSDRLQDRREVTAGTRAYSVGFQDGRFYANGWHITGEMGGVWAPPLKLADGLWFGVDDQWAGQATKFTSGRGYTRYDLPPAAGLELRRIDFVPDGRRAALYGLELGNPGPAAKTVTVKVDVRSELLGAYPWGFDNVVPNAKDNLADKAAFDNGALVFTDAGTLPGGEPHDYAMLAASDRRPSGGETGPGHWGPQPGTRCAASDQVAPRFCDDGPFGNGAGGQLQYRVTVKPHSRETVWIALAGSDRGLQAARRELSDALRDPGRLLAEKAASRARAVRALGPRPARRPPAAGGRRLGQAEHRRPHADRDRPADPLRRPGQAVPGAGHDPARGHVRRRGLPGLSVDVRHRRRVHGVRLGRRRPVRGDQGAPARRCATSPTRSTPAAARSRTRS